MSCKKIIICGLLWIAATSCMNRQDRRALHQAAGAQAGEHKDSVVYTCPMHPQIREHAAGKCPICHMTLVSLTPPPSANSRDNKVELTVSSRGQFLAGMHMDTAHKGRLRQELLLTGTTLFDPNRQSIVSARVDGRIEKMYVREPGREIAAGRKLYDLYSPDLLSAEKDYTLALQQKKLFPEATVDLGATIQAMRQKLLRWGLSPQQVDRLPHEPPTGKVTVYSNTSGYLIQKMKEEGEYVKEGEPVLAMAGNNRLWVEAQLYDDELPLLPAAPVIWVELPGTAQKLPGKIVFDNPVNADGSRVHPLYITIPNPEGKIQPGALAYVHLQTGAGKQALLIPRSAVTYGAQEEIVWVALPGYAFERREVQLGPGDPDMVQVLQGIQPEERVVISGTFLLNSEYTLTHGMGMNLSGMQMSDMKMSGRK